MILFINVVLKEIFEQGRNFSWAKPEKCPGCGRWKIWGHGFVQALFDGFSRTLWLKRYRCPDCKCVITMRPTSHFSRFQSSRETIRSALEHRLNHGKWPPNMTPARMRHWLRNLKLQVKAHLTDVWKSGLLAGFDQLADMGRIPVSSSI
ncbi:MAG: hypothetical protein HQK66_14565 [Desulfamplus sp.]|nr:hypothetical protein [Desulfamplus sp.]